MPIGERPLLEYWLETLWQSDIRDVLVNLHYLSEIVQNFLIRPRFRGWVDAVKEEELLGTAGTLRLHADFFKRHTTLLVHADNWCQCDFADFLLFHQRRRPEETMMTMMTFDTEFPQSCGIVGVDTRGVVQAFHEKVANPPGTKANAAVYLLEPEVLEWLVTQPQSSDFSTQVLPNYLGRIATWHNNQFHRDIGTLQTLRQAQLDPRPETFWTKDDAWQQQFLQHPIHQELKELNVT
jgi:mannose-1-phosphate guanylyltransferase